MYIYMVPKTDMEKSVYMSTYISCPQWNGNISIDIHGQKWQFYSY